MSEAHSKYSASGFEAAMLCPGKPVLERGKPNNGNTYSREGTAAHQLLEWCITESKRADAYLGRVIEVEGDSFEVDSEMAEHINWCLDQIVAYAGETGVVMAEQRVYYAEAIGVPRDEGWGTADVIILRGNEIVVMDLKYGRGVEVSAVENTQMRLYALGALDAHDGVVDDFTHARMVILQPRTSRAPSEWDCSVADLRKWAANEAWPAVDQRQAAEMDYPSPDWDERFLASGSQCRFCKAKATCPALRADVADTVFAAVPASPDEFEGFADGLRPEIGTTEHSADAAWVAACLSKVDMIEDWCKAIRAEAERRLLAGETVPGFKVVQGKRGARAWSDAKAAEEMLKGFRLKVEEMYDLKLISPTSAEKLTKAEAIGPRQWTKLAALITQADGKPHVAPASDPRPAIEVKPVEDEFDDVSPAGSTVDDLA